MNTLAPRDLQAIETVDLSQLGFPKEAVTPGAEFPVHEATATARIWSSAEEANLAMVQLRSRRSMTPSLKDLLSERSSWPSALVVSEDRVIGHLFGASSDGVIPESLTEVASPDAWLWFCALAHDVQRAGWTLGGIAKSVTFNSQGLPIAWSNTTRARHYSHFGSFEKFRAARDSERAEFGWLLMNSLGHFESDSHQWVPSDDVPEETASALPLLHARLFDERHRPPTIREWQLALVGPGLVHSIADRRKRTSSHGGTTDLVMVVLPFADAERGAWRERWSRTLHEINQRSPNAQIAAFPAAIAAAPLLPSRPSDADRPPLLVQRPESWNASEVIERLWERVRTTRLTLTSAGWNVEAIHLLFPEELAIPGSDLMAKNESKWCFPVTVHDFRSDGSLRARYEHSMTQTSTPLDLIDLDDIPAADESRTTPVTTQAAGPEWQTLPQTTLGAPVASTAHSPVNRARSEGTETDRQKSPFRWILVVVLVLALILAAGYVLLFRL